MQNRLTRLAAFLGRNDRFLTPRMLASIGVYLFVAASYLQARVTDDGVIYYDFMRRLVGEDVPAYAYQFGVVFWNLPFYVASRLVRMANDDDWVEHVHIGQAAVAIASTSAVVAIFYVCWRLIRELGLPGGPGAILLTVFGSPLFYYGIFQTGLKHAFDALLVTVLALLLLRSTLRPPTTRLAIFIGLVLALLISVRYANIVLLVGVIYIFARRRFVSHAYAAALSATLGATAILALPLVLGIPYGFPPNEPAAAAEPVAASVPVGDSPVRFAAAHDVQPVIAASGVDDVSSYDIDVLAPAKMLFTIRRGLFVWTPLTFFGVIGYVLLTAAGAETQGLSRRARAERARLVARPHHLGRLLVRRLLVLAAVPDRSLSALRDRDR